MLNGNRQIDPERVDISLTDSAEGTYDYVIGVDMYASQLATSYTLKLKGVDTSDFCITYGVYNYCIDAQKQTGSEFTDTLKILCKAIHNYGQKVQAFIKNQGE